MLVFTLDALQTWLPLHVLVIDRGGPSWCHATHALLVLIDYVELVGAQWPICMFFLELDAQSVALLTPGKWVNYATWGLADHRKLPSESIFHQFDRWQLELLVRLIRK